MYLALGEHLWLMPEGGIDTRALIVTSSPGPTSGPGAPPCPTTSACRRRLPPAEGNLHGELGPGPTDDAAMDLGYMHRGLEGLFMAWALRDRQRHRVRLDPQAALDLRGAHGGLRVQDGLPHVPPTVA